MDGGKKVKAFKRLLTGGLSKPEPYKEEAEETSGGGTFKIAFEVTGEYPDGTRWKRPATEEEAREYNSWSE